MALPCPSAGNMITSGVGGFNVMAPGRDVDIDFKFCQCNVEMTAMQVQTATQVKATAMHVLKR